MFNRLSRPRHLHRARRPRAALVAVVAGVVLALSGSALPAQADDAPSDTPSDTSDPGTPSTDNPDTGNPGGTPSKGATDGPSTGTGTPDGAGKAADAQAGPLTTSNSQQSIVFTTPRQMPTPVSGGAPETYRIDVSLDKVHWASSLTKIPGYYGEKWEVKYYKTATGYGNWVLYTPASRPATNATGTYTHTIYWRTRTPQGTPNSNESTMTANVGSWCGSRTTPGPIWYSYPTRFNYPYSSRPNQTAIKQQALAAINATPCGQTILAAFFAINDGGYDTAKALYAAHLRGVNVRVMSDSHEVYGPEDSSSYKWLMARLGTSTNRPLVSWSRPAASYAQICIRACRGVAGNHHYKMLLITQTGQYRNLAMTGSANLTSKAAFGQWNHMDTTTCNIFTNAGCANAEALAVPYRAMFYQLVTRYKGGTYKTSGVTPYTQFYPIASPSPSNDVVYQNLNAVQCVYGGGKHTQILIGQYAWFEERGVWLAQKVRALWNAGCDVRVHYAVMGNTVKSILYSSAGRGRIPMRQVATYYSDGTVANYDHSKYMVIKGSINGAYQARVISGTTNYNNMGFFSDDFTTIFPNDPAKADAYALNFGYVYNGPHSRVPSPTSQLPGEPDRGRLKFGQGRYVNLEPS